MNSGPPCKDLPSFGFVRGLLEVRRPNLSWTNPFEGVVQFHFKTHTTAPFALGPHKGNLYWNPSSNTIAIPFPATDGYRGITSSAAWKPLVHRLSKSRLNTVDRGPNHELSMGIAFDAASYLKAVEYHTDHSLLSYCKLLYILLPRMTIASLNPVSPHLYALEIPLTLAPQSLDRVTGLLQQFPQVVSAQGTFHAPPNLAFLPVATLGEPTQHTAKSAAKATSGSRPFHER